MSLLRPDEDLAPSPLPPAPPRRHPRRHRLAIALTVFLAAAVVLVGAGVAYAVIQNSRLKTIDSLNKASGGRSAAVAKVVKGAPVNILVVGNDSRSFAKDAADKKQFGATTVGDSLRSDTMMVMRLDPKNDRATVLSIARDLYVDLEGGGRGRINEAFAQKGDPSKSDPDRLIRTINANFGITINHYVEIDFGGFRDVVDAIGGVKVYFPNPARDAYSLLKIDTPGCVQLNGRQALSYVRSRHYEFKTDKGWQSDPNSDLSRIQRQQDFIKRVLRKAVADGLTNPITAARLIEAGIGNVRVDGGFSVGDMKSLASQLRDLNEGKVAFEALTGDPVSIDGADVLKLNPASAAGVLSAFGATLPGTSARNPRGAGASAGVPAGTDVVLYNGSGRDGLVAQVQSDLRRLGVPATSGGNGQGAATTQIRYRTGGVAAARAVQAYMGSDATLSVDRSVRTGEVLVLLGRGFSQVVDPRPSAATVTTVPPALVTSPTTKPAPGSDPSVAC